MTTNPQNPSNRPLHKNGYNPITLEDLQRHGTSAAQTYFDLHELTSPVARCFAIPLLFMILSYTLRTPIVAPLILLVLLGCVLVRLENHPRHIAAVPLTLSSIKLAFLMESSLEFGSLTHIKPGNTTWDPGFVWLPLFFSTCLILIPKRDSVTFKIVLASACVLLASGLLPAEGFLIIFYLLEGTLFFTIVVGIFADLKGNLPLQTRVSPRPAQ
jgi:hypothetical protein